MSNRSFSIVREVTQDDIDDLGHANNIAYVRWIQEIAVAHSEAVGLGFAGYARLGAVFVVRRHEIDYLRPLVRGDRIEVRTWISTVMAAKCVRTTEMLREGTAVARSATTWGFVDAATGRPTRIPDEVRAAFGYSARARSAPPGGPDEGPPEAPISQT